jgi:hypothetical protein
VKGEPGLGSAATAGIVCGIAFFAVIVAAEIAFFKLIYPKIIGNVLDRSVQQNFSFILFGIGGAILIRPICLWSKLKVIFSILIETCELIAYLTVLPRTANLIIFWT